jgi:hypothetical protein
MDGATWIILLFFWKRKTLLSVVLCCQLDSENVSYHSTVHYLLRLAFGMHKYILI